MSSAVAGAALSFSLERTYHIVGWLIQRQRGDSGWTDSVADAAASASKLSKPERKRLKAWLAKKQSWEDLLDGSVDQLRVVTDLANDVYLAHVATSGATPNEVVPVKQQSAEVLLHHVCRAVFESTDSATAVTAIAHTLAQKERADLGDALQNLLADQATLANDLEEHQRIVLRTVATTLAAAAVWEALEPAEFPLPERFAASMLLRPRFRVVPWFEGHGLLGQLQDWLSSSGQVAILSGSGGAGKTRVAVELCADAMRRGIVGGFLRSDVNPSLDVVNMDALVVVDYAETRVKQVQRWLSACGESAATTAKVLLLVRGRPSETSYLQAHRFLGASDAADALLSTAEHLTFDDVEWFPEDLYGLSISAGEEFADRLEMPHRPIDYKGNDPFEVSVGSLEAVLGGGRRVELLGHELRYLHASAAQALEPLPIGPDEVDQCLALSTILATTSQSRLRQELAEFPALKGLPGNAYGRVSRWLSTEYGGPEGIGVMSPDRLAEQFVSRVFDQFPDVLEHLLAHPSTGVLERTMTILNRIAQDADSDTPA